MLNPGGPGFDAVIPSVLPPEDWKCLYERDHTRAETADAEFTALKIRLGEASANDWKLESIRARSDFNGLRGVIESNREKLAAMRVALKELHRSRSARNLCKLEINVARLGGLQNAAGIDSGPHAILGMRKEILTRAPCDRRAH